MLDDLVTPALRAAVAVGTRFGLPVAEPEIVSTKANVLVRLGSVLARVPATTRLTRPDAADWLARDVRLARLSAKCGAPVIGPSTDPPAGSHLAEGLPVTLWPFTQHDPAHQYRPADLAGSLAELHRCPRDR